MKPPNNNVRNPISNKRAPLKTISALLVVGAVGALGACGGDDEGKAEMLVASSGLEPLRNGYLYEMWAIIDGAPVTAGKFNVDLSGTITDADGIPIAGSRLVAGRDLSVATDFVVTIEPTGDENIIPSETKILGGEPDGNGATLTTAHAGTGFADDFSDAEGRFILATPTDGADSNENSGVWFLDLSVEPAVAGLQLPELGEGWEYEGWVVFPDGADMIPVSTGRFTAVDMADDNDMFSGAQSGPAVPGEDFLMGAPSPLSFPTNLSERTVVISVEPEPDDSPAPFVLKPLVATVPASAADHQTFPMNNNAAVFPMMEVTLVATE